MKIKRRIMWTCILILYTGFIFRNSLTPALQSSQQSDTALAVFLAMFRTLGLKTGWLTQHLVRKAAHFAEYFLLGIFLWKCLQSYEIPRRTWLMAHLWLMTAIPLADETFQLFTEGRSGQVGDVWLDISGLAAGSLFAVGICYFIYKEPID